MDETTKDGSMNSIADGTKKKNSLSKGAIKTRRWRNKKRKAHENAQNEVAELRVTYENLLSENHLLKEQVRQLGGTDILVGFDNTRSFPPPRSFSQQKSASKKSDNIKQGNTRDGDEGIRKKKKKNKRLSASIPDSVISVKDSSTRNSSKREEIEEALAIAAAAQSKPFERFSSSIKICSSTVKASIDEKMPSKVELNKEDKDSSCVCASSETSVSEPVVLSNELSMVQLGFLANPDLYRTKNENGPTAHAEDFSRGPAAAVEEKPLLGPWADVTDSTGSSGILEDQQLSVSNASSKSMTTSPATNQKIDDTFEERAQQAMKVLQLLQAKQKHAISVNGAADAYHPGITPSMLQNMLLSRMTAEQQKKPTSISLPASHLPSSSASPLSALMLKLVARQQEQKREEEEKYRLAHYLLQQQQQQAQSSRIVAAAQAEAQAKTQSETLRNENGMSTMPQEQMQSNSSAMINMLDFLKQLAVKGNGS